MPNPISTETRQHIVQDNTVYISVITFNNLPQEDGIDTNQEMGVAYQSLAEQLLIQPGVEKQKSACLITNLEPIQEVLTQEVLEDWYDNVMINNIQTQQILYQYFKRPTFSIITLPGIDETYVKQQQPQVNPNANPVHVVNNFEEALALAQRLLEATHKN